MTYPDPHDQINASSDIEELRRLAHAWLDTAAQHARNEEFYRNIVDQTGLILGRECCRQDDGHYTDEPLALRVPKVAQKLVDALTHYGAIETLARRVLQSFPHAKVGFALSATNDDWCVYNGPAFILGHTTDDIAKAHAYIDNYGMPSDPLHL